MARIGVAVVGAGFIGGVHAEALRRAGCEVVGVLGVSDAESTKFAEAIGAPKAYGSLKELLDDKAVESVHIGTPNKLHFEIAKAAIEAGKHVLCEKPLAMTSKETAELVELARKHPKLAAGVNYNIRFYPLTSRPASGCAAASWARSTTSRAATCRTGSPRHRLQLAGPGRRGRGAAGGGRHRHPLAGPRPLHHRPGGRGRLRRPPHRPPGPPAAEGRGRDLQRQARQGVRPRAGRHHDRGLRRHPPALQRRRAGHPRGLAGDGGPQELPPLRDRRRRRAPWPGTARTPRSCGSVAEAGRTSC